MEVDDTENAAELNPSEPGAELEAAAQSDNRWVADAERTAQASPPVIAFTASTEDEAEIVRGILESEGVPAFVLDHSSRPFGDALIAGDTHWGDVLVAPSDLGRAEELIESYRNANVTDEMIEQETPTDQ